MEKFHNAKMVSNLLAMKELIETIVKPLVDFPDDVHVMFRKRILALPINFLFNKSDMGKVIGKQGRVAKAITNCRICSRSTSLNKKHIWKLRSSMVRKSARTSFRCCAFSLSYL